MAAWKNNKKVISSTAECRAACFRLLSRRGYSVQELRLKLSERGAAPQQIEETLEILKQQGYVDDVNLCESIVHYRSTITRHGIYAVKRELMQRGIDEEIVQYVLAEQYGEDDEAEAAWQYLQRQCRRLHLNDRNEMPWQRLYELLRKRGFSTAAATAALEQMKMSD